MLTRQFFPCRARMHTQANIVRLLCTSEPRVCRHKNVAILLTVTCCGLDLTDGAHSEPRRQDHQYRIGAIKFVIELLISPR